MAGGLLVALGLRVMIGLSVARCVPFGCLIIPPPVGGFPGADCVPLGLLVPCGGLNGRLVARDPPNVGLTGVSPELTLIGPVTGGVLVVCLRCTSNPFSPTTTVTDIISNKDPSNTAPRETAILVTAIVDIFLYQFACPIVIFISILKRRLALA